MVLLFLSVLCLNVKIYTLFLLDEICSLFFFTFLFCLSFVCYGTNFLVRFESLGSNSS